MAKKTKPIDPADVDPLLEDTVAYIEGRALEIEGLFRIPGMDSDVKKLYKQYQSGKRPDLTKYLDPSTVCSLLKLYLRNLDEPITTFELYDCFKVRYTTHPR